MKKISIILALGLLAACQNSSNNHFYKYAAKDAVAAEDLLKISSERVTFAASSATVLHDLNRMLKNDLPTKAELSCAKDHVACKKMENILEAHNVSYKYVAKSEGSGNVALIYDKLVAQDCEQIITTENGEIYVSKPLGCAVAANSLQMISNHKQFIKPSLLGAPYAADLRETSKHKCHKCHKNN